MYLALLLALRLVAMTREVPLHEKPEHLLTEVERIKLRAMEPGGAIVAEHLERHRRQGINIATVNIVEAARIKLGTHTLGLPPKS